MATAATSVASLTTVRESDDATRQGLYFLIPVFGAVLGAGCTTHSGTEDQSAPIVENISKNDRGEVTAESTKSESPLTDSTSTAKPTRNLRCPLPYCVVPDRGQASSIEEELQGVWCLGGGGVKLVVENSTVRFSSARQRGLEVPFVVQYEDGEMFLLHRSKHGLRMEVECGCDVLYLAVSSIVNPYFRSPDSDCDFAEG